MNEDVLSKLIEVLSVIVSDAPLLVEVVEKVVAIFKSKEAPTADDFTELNALLDQTHTALQNENKSWFRNNNIW